MGWTYCYSHFAGVDVHLFFLSWAVTLFLPFPTPQSVQKAAQAVTHALRAPRGAAARALQ